MDLPPIPDNGNHGNRDPMVIVDALNRLRITMREMLMEQPERATLLVELLNLGGEHEKKEFPIPDGNVSSYLACRSASEGTESVIVMTEEASPSDSMTRNGNSPDPQFHVSAYGMSIHKLGLRAVNTGGKVEEQDFSAPAPTGIIPDYCRRYLGCETEPPEIGVAVLHFYESLRDLPYLLEAAGRGNYTWGDVTKHLVDYTFGRNRSRRRKIFQNYSDATVEMLSKLTPENVADLIQDIASQYSWGHYRVWGVAAGYPKSFYGVEPRIASWMDEGVFSRAVATVVTAKTEEMFSIISQTRGVSSEILDNLQQVRTLIIEQ